MNDSNCILFELKFKINGNLIKIKYLYIKRVESSDRNI